MMKGFKTGKLSLFVLVYRPTFPLQSQKESGPPWFVI